MADFVTLLWNYLIEIQDITATLRALVDNPNHDTTLAELLKVRTPAQIIQEMAEEARREPVCAGMENPGDPVQD